MKRIQFFIGIILVALVVTMLVGCGKKKLEGPITGNVPPIINWSNIPQPDSVFHSNGILSWYGRDIDGRVVEYFYMIEVADSIQNDPEGFIDSLLPPDTAWLHTDQTRVDVSLIAAPTEGDTLTQYVFVKCQDNNGAFSPVIYRRFERVNHYPETNIQIFPGISVSNNGDTTRESEVWCLPDTNALWTGLRITWEGTDTLDFPINPPPFTYQAKLYGPYDTSLFSGLTIADTSTAVRCSTWYDSTTHEPWIYAKALKIKDLRTGAYIFTVRTRDDALTSDPTPAWNKFRCVEPVWISDPSEAVDVALIQATQYRDDTTSFVKSTFYRNRPHGFPDLVSAFYQQMITSAGHTVTIFGTAPSRGSFTVTPPLHFLAKYRMVIVDNMDWDKVDLRSESGVETDLAIAVRKYLMIGGKVWVIGRQAFGPGAVGNSGWETFASSSLPYQFFDLDGATYGVYTSNQVAEFIGASSISPAFENLEVDSVKCGYLLQTNITKVEGLARASGTSVSLFTFDAVNPDTSREQGLPVAIVYEPRNHVFKTSYFAIPLYLMDNSEGKVQDVFDVMLAWFLQE